MFHQAVAAYVKPPSNSIVLPAFERGHSSQGASPSATQLVYASSHPGDDRGLQTIAGLWLNSASGSLGRSAGYVGVFPLFESQVPGEFVGEGGSTNEGSKSWKRSEDGNDYVQCVTAVYALARDQSPCVACLGQQVLRIMGVESAQIVVAAKAGANEAISHERNPSADSEWAGKTTNDDVYLKAQETKELAKGLLGRFAHILGEASMAIQDTVNTSSERVSDQ